MKYLDHPPPRTLARVSGDDVYDSDNQIGFGLLDGIDLATKAGKALYVARLQAVARNKPPGDPQGDQARAKLAKIQLAKLQNPPSRIGGAVSGTIFPSVWANSVVGAADESNYMNPDIDAGIGSDDPIQTKDDQSDVSAIVGFDQEMSSIEAEDDGDSGVGADRRGQRRAQRVTKRAAEIAQRAQRAKARGRGRRAARLARRANKGKQLAQKIQQRAAQRAGRRVARQDRRQERAETRAMRAMRGRTRSLAEEIGEFAPALPQEGQLCVLPFLSGSVTSIRTALKGSTKGAVSSTTTWTTQPITYAELRLIGMYVEVATFASGLPGVLSVEVSDLAGQGNLPALYGTQTKLIEQNVFTSGVVATPVAESTGFVRLVVIGLRDKARIRMNQTIGVTTKLIMPTQAAVDVIAHVGAGAIVNVIEDTGAADAD